MKQLRITLWSCLALLLAASFAFAERPAHEKGKEERSLSKVAAYQPDIYQLLNINNLWSWHRRDGQANHSPTGDNGTFYPRGTAWSIYQDGMVFGSKAYLDAAKTQPAPYNHTIRVGGTTYATGQRQGWVTGQGATAAFADPGDARARIYRVRRDWKEAFYNADGSFTQDARRDAAESNEIGVGSVTNAQVQQIVDRYLKDWNEWPVDLGAPYVERNGTPGYQAPPADFTAASLIVNNYDEPGIAGADPKSPADQVLWTVFNDLHEPTSVGRFGSEPQGLEIQMTMWAYKRTDALGNIFFRKWRFINKGGVDIDGTAGSAVGALYLDSMYVCQWSDPDLGNSGDDLTGCDTTLSVGFIYNGNAIDSDYRRFNLPPPSAGYDFLQGPLLKTGNAADRAVFDLKYVNGAKNLGMTGFSYFSAGSNYSDPGGGYLTNTLLWYKMLRGYAPLEGPDVRYNHPPDLVAGAYPLAGDPVRGKGHVDGLGTNYSFQAGDRRLLVITGPFNMAPSDTQEVVVACVNGIGSDRLSSVSVMKFNDRFAQNTYDALFQVPRPPEAPDVQLTELDGHVVLVWGSNLTQVTDTEVPVNDPGSYKFEGYNIYQFPSPSANLATAKRIVTYDLPSDPAVVTGEDVDLASGLVLVKPLHFGSNSTLKRYFKFERDHLKDRDKLNNGEEYYVAVTAYSVSTIENYIPAALESEVIVRTIRAKVPFGTKFQIAYGDTLPVSHTTSAKPSDGQVYPIVVDPRVGTGKTYEVRFDVDAEGKTMWSLIDKASGTPVSGASNQLNQSADENYNIINGLFLVVSGPPPGLKEWSWTGSRFLTWAGGDGFAFEGFNGAIGWASPRTVFGDGVTFIPADKTKNIEIRFANVNAADASFDPNHPNVSYAYRHGRGFAAPPVKPEFAPFIKNPSGGYSYQEFAKSVPLAVYDIENPAAPRRLALAHLENNQPGGLVDGKYWPPIQPASNTAGDGPREWLWIFDSDYSETPNPDYQNEIIGVDANATLDGSQPVMYFATWDRRNSNNWVDTDKFTHISNKPNTPADVFTFTLPAAEKSLALSQASANTVGVFPNPYFAFNPQEISRLARFVTFNNLPEKATVRIFNLGGQMVARLEKNDATQFLRWTLLNLSNLPVASGMYIAHVDMPEVGVTKVLKLAIIQEGEVLETF